MKSLKLLLDCRIIYALKKHEAIDRLVVKKRNLGTKLPVSKFFDPKISQVCETCPILAHFNEALIMNGQDLILNQSLTCKIKSIIYVEQCRICSRIKNYQGKVLFEDKYFGQTVTKAHVRFDVHRKCFRVNDSETIGKSALSQHCFDKHPQHFALSNFRVGIEKV